MAGPFFRGVDRGDLYAVATMALATQTGNPAQAAAVLAAIEQPASQKFYPQVGDAPPATLLLSPTFTIAIVGGITTVQQWVKAALTSTQAPQAGVPGNVGLFFAVQAQALKATIGADLIELYNGRSVVWVGYSLGGACVQILQQMLAPQVTSPQSIFVFGCPRVGDSTFAAAFPAGQLSRVENVGDPVPALPPVVWAGPGSSYPIPGLPPFAVYAHGGQANSLDAGGNLAPGDVFSGEQAIFNWLFGADANGPHTIAEYVRRLKLQLPTPAPPPPPDEWDVNQIAEIGFDIIFEPETAETFEENNVPLPNNKIEVFYEFMGDGFSEIWYSNATVAALKATYIPQYVAARLQLMTSGAQALYGRISQIGKPRQIDFWVPGSGASPPMSIKNPTNQTEAAYFGSYNGPDVQPQQALLLRLLNTGGFWSRLFMHAFPQEVIQLGYYFPTPGFLTTLQKFINYLAGASSQWLDVSTVPNTVQNRVQITTITAGAIRGAQIVYVVPNPTPPGWPPAVGNTITVGGAGAQEYGMNGRKRITSINPANNSFTVGGAAPIGATQPGSAYFYLDQFQFYPLSLGQVERLTTRKVGKPVFEPRGRRSNILALRR